ASFIQHMAENFFPAVSITFAGKKTTHRKDIVPTFIREQARERYSTIRESMFPLEEAAKQIVYIDTLIYLLDEQGFEFKQSIEGNHRVVDKIGRREFEKDASDEEVEEESFNHKYKRGRGKGNPEEFEMIEGQPVIKTEKVLRTGTRGTSKRIGTVDGRRRLYLNKVGVERDQDDHLLISERNAQDRATAKESEILMIPKDKMPVVIVPAVSKMEKATYLRF
ncbi:2598_t:CDS:2, partial [Acaulospora colombiana]